MFSIDNIGFGKTLTKLESQIELSQETIEYSTNDLYLKKDFLFIKYIKKI